MVEILEGRPAEATVTEFPSGRALPLSEHPFFLMIFITFLALGMDNSTYEARLELALEDLSKQPNPNFLSTAKTYQVHRTTLARRFKGTQQNQRIARAETHQCLSLAQEETLIRFINNLTDRSLPPTSQIVHNVAEELSGKPVHKNWVGQFVKRYKDRLHAVYLRTIDNKRVKADHIPSLERFYKLVSLSLSLIIAYMINNIIIIIVIG
jgi:hypothetical protein